MKNNTRGSHADNKIFQTQLNENITGGEGDWEVTRQEIYSFLENVRATRRRRQRRIIFDGMIEPFALSDVFGDMALPRTRTQNGTAPLCRSKLHIKLEF